MLDGRCVPMNAADDDRPEPRTHAFVAIDLDDSLAQALVAASSGLAFAGRTPVPDDAPALLTDTGAGVAVVALRDPHDAAHAIRAAAHSSPPPIVVAVVDELDAGRVADALAAGASVVVPRRPAASATVASLPAALAGAVVVPPALAAMLVLHDRGVHLPALTDDERRLLGLLVAGLDNAEIAATVFASVRTVKRMLQVLYAKLGVRGRTEAALVGVRAGIEPPHPELA